MIPPCMNDHKKWTSPGDSWNASRLLGSDARVMLTGLLIIFRNCAVIKEPLKDQSHCEEWNDEAI